MFAAVRNIALLLILFFNELSLKSQNCNILVSLKNCVGEPVSFKSSSTGTASAYQWDFNGEGSSTAPTPVFIFNSPGTKKITLKLFFSGGATCTQLVNIEVNAPPVWKVKVDTAQSFFCLKGNKICIRDESQRGPANEAIKQRVVVWGDGAYDVNSNPESDRSDCHSYSKTGIYDITVEITDNSGCKVSNHFTVKIAKSLDVSFSYEISYYCDSTRVCLTNTSSFDTLENPKYVWEIGGVKDSSFLASYCRYFGSDANIQVALRMSNTYCSDTAYDSLKIKAGFLKARMRADRRKVCYSDRAITFRSNKYPGANYEWRIYDESNTLRGLPFSSGNDSFINLLMPGLGKYYITVKINVANCEMEVTDTVEVVGAMAKFSLVNSKQCSPLDTVYACPQTVFYKTDSGALKYLWYFADPSAPSCTTSIPNTNCNWQNIRNGARHFYHSNGCYPVTLIITDTINNCIDQDAIPVSIGKPDLADLGYNFVSHCYRPGTKISPYTYEFFTVGLLPECGVTHIYVNTDSLRSNVGFEPLSLVNNPFYIYDSVIDPDGWVTIGVILEQGYSNLGLSCSSYSNVSRICRDTFWYHHEYRILPEPQAGYHFAKNKGCKPLTVKAELNQPVQKYISRAIWNWDDGSIDTVYYFPGDSIIAAATHEYRKSGIYNPILILTNENGCHHYFNNKVTVGYYNAILSDSVQCSQAVFDERIEYFGIITNNWKNPDRAAAGKEQVWWDFGDGSTGVGPEPTHYYPNTGVYNVKLISVDSSGCRDTLTQQLHIVGPKAGIRAPFLVSVCNEIISFFDSSQKMGTDLYDSIVSYYWDFGDMKNPSTLKDATHAYSYFGDFTITHAVTNMRGCSDTTEIKIKTIGPQPSFIIDGDSDGCQPFTVKLKSTSDSSTITDYIWKFGDPDSNFVSHKTDSSVSFTYVHPGVYYPALTGAKSVYSPTTGNTYYCVARYPDPPLHRPLKVTVWRRPPVDFMSGDTFCPGQIVTFEDKSDTVYSRFRWLISNGDSIFSLTSPVTWSTMDTGEYTILYVPEYDPTPPEDQCPDTASRKIYIAPVFADFVIDTLKSSDPIFVFKNQSKFASKYFWDFGHPASNANVSFEVHPTHNYDPDTGYFNVCLRARNSLGCEDTICRLLHITFFPYVFYYNVFTPANHDEKNDDFDIDIHGETAYDLKIYNRWGMLVFESTSDAEPGENKNWNGKIQNTGEDCPAGVYYYIFNYRILQRDPKTVHGTVTLIRE